MQVFIEKAGIVILLNPVSYVRITELYPCICARKESTPQCVHNRSVLKALDTEIVYDVSVVLVNIPFSTSSSLNFQPKILGQLISLITLLLFAYSIVSE